MNTNLIYSKSSQVTSKRSAKRIQSKSTNCKLNSNPGQKKKGENGISKKYKKMLELFCGEYITLIIADRYSKFLLLNGRVTKVL